MKIRTDFVTNSSSSSFVFWGFYSKELVNFVKELIDRGLVYHYDEYWDTLSDKEEHMTCDLRFFPWKRDKTIGFQIEEERVYAHKNPLDALMSYIDLSKLPESEASEIAEKITGLVKKSKADNQILHDFGEGVTDDINNHFDENDLYLTFFKVDYDTLVSCWNKKLDTVNIKSWKKVKNIGESAFKNMKNLECVSVEYGFVKEIGINAFAECKNLRTVNISDPYYRIGNRYIKPEKYPDCSFIGCNNIRKNAFCGCESLNAVFIEAKNVEACAFKGCHSIEAVAFYNSIRSIGDCAFQDCKNLRDVYLNDVSFDGKKGVKKISPDAFSGCENVVLHVKEGTYAHRYAIRKKLKFELE